MNLFNYCHGDVLIATSPIPPIVMTQPTHFLLHLLPVIRVLFLKNILTFANILALTLSACYNVHSIVTITRHFLSDLLYLASVCTFKCFPSVKTGQATLHLLHLWHPASRGGAPRPPFLIPVTILCRFLGCLEVICILSPSQIALSFLTNIFLAFLTHW